MEQLESFDFQYPWDLWLDGSVWKLTQGVDFDCETVAFRARAISAGRMRKGRTRTRCLDSDTVVIQFVAGERT